MKSIKSKYLGNSWKEIAEEFNSLAQTQKTSEQIRHKCLNASLAKKNSPKTTDWSEEDLKKLYNFYLEEGPEWSKFSADIPNKYFRVLT